MAKGRGKSGTGSMAAAVIHILLITAGILILIFAAKTAYSIGYSVFTTGAMEDAPGEDVVVTIRDSMTDREIGELLEEKGLIRNGSIYRIQAKVYDYEPIPGTYLLNTSETLDEMMEILMTPSDESGSESESESGSEFGSDTKLSTAGAAE